MRAGRGRPYALHLWGTQTPTSNLECAVGGAVGARSERIRPLCQGGGGDTVPRWGQSKSLVDATKFRCRMKD
ncbi:hypothetical protein PVAP13_7KG116865 [Panicum virgatum]|uniref:Uncharacterized protein n=1 Tax=Panicum virgatum TaxID=38727 RepID=A0A8T0QDZ4_PANVG|nr:hypothetical protein PVAP13_7KG116865 [Panicum virgatum]